MLQPMRAAGGVVTCGAGREPPGWRWLIHTEMWACSAVLPIVRFGRLLLAGIGTSLSHTLCDHLISGMWQVGTWPRSMSPRTTIGAGTIDAKDDRSSGGASRRRKQGHTFALVADGYRAH